MVACKILVQQSQAMRESSNIELPSGPSSASPVHGETRNQNAVLGSVSLFFAIASHWCMMRNDRHRPDISHADGV